MLRAFLADTMTGLVGEPIDVPGLRWSLSVSDSSMETTRDKGTGDATATGLHVPWSAVPATTPEGRERALAPLRRSVLLAWEEDGSLVPLVVGAIGSRVDSWEDTSFSLVSPMGMLSSRYVVREGAFGTAPGSATTDTIHWSGWSLRSIASGVVSLGMSKPGGTLPIDLPHYSERGGHERTYDGFNVQNLSVADVLEKIANVLGGPDIQIRPYMADGTHYRLRLEAGSDSEPYLGQGGLVPTITCFAGGGTAQSLRVAHQGPTMRVYATGAGEDKAMLCHLSEDLSLVTQADPWPLVEAAAGFSDDERAGLLASHADARLAATSRPLCQVTCEVRLGEGVHAGETWPGMLVDLDLRDHPALPDGTYRLRLMEMSGDLSGMAKLIFDPIENPWYARRRP